MQAHLRIARPTDNLDAIVEMYRLGLGLEPLGSFEDHGGFDGAMLGHRGAAYHIEFTSQRGHPVGRAPNAEHLLVFYLPDRQEWEAACKRITAAGFKTATSHNPYWDRQGRTFEDLDGYRVVLQQVSWD